MSVDAVQFREPSGAGGGVFRRAFRPKARGESARPSAGRGGTPRLIRQRHRITAAVLFMGDLAASLGAFFLAWILRFEFEVVPLTKTAPELGRYVDLLPFVLVLFPVVFYFHGLYRPRSSGSRVD